jgi:tRNA nucleotidyltransferase (CCA-adding enzyme)
MRSMGDLNLQQLQDRLAPQLWEVLMQAAALAERQCWHLYLVGGAVRDLLLASADNKQLLIPDIDLAVDGLDRIADAGAGVELAKLLQQLYPSVRLDVHGTFKTAALLWEEDPLLAGLSIDIATARTESYPYPAANPIVEASSIRQDLYRRDFTINAMALRLTVDRSTPAPQAGILLDLYGGLADLQAKQLRVLHPESFIDDPTRIYRGARFAARLGFHFESQTISYFQSAIASGIYQRTATEHAKTPALQTRLKAELKYLLQAKYWQAALKLLDELGALQCIQPTLTLNRDTLAQLSLLERGLRRFDPKRELASWQLRLEAILVRLAPDDRQPVAINLQLPAESIARLENFAVAESLVRSHLPIYDRPSQCVKLLRQYDRATLILIAVRGDRGIRRQIWRYLTVWMHVRSLLTGNDLQQLGHKPGAQFRKILDELTIATLDGEIGDRVAAEAFVTNLSFS